MTVQLGPWAGVYNPSYRLEVFKQGNPKARARNVNLNSVDSISTSKSLQDIAGTFTITLKDHRARHEIASMDVVKIWLKGHRYGMAEVLRGVVDEVQLSGAVDPNSGQEDCVITGRCMAKWLQVNSLFLPVWDPTSILPTALTFGMGDVLKKAGAITKNQVGRDTPKGIFDYLLTKFVYGQRNMVGESGTPNARFWISTSKRFEKVKTKGGDVFRVPFIQFDEDTIDNALKRFEILGFTEAWVDELGNIVYRQPQWDARVTYKLTTNNLQGWQLSRSDVGLYTYVEVVPTGNPGLASSYAQALMAGRAPVPSVYLQSINASGYTGDNPIAAYTDREYIIETDPHGNATAKGRKNRWYGLQRSLGLRPLQISSPLLFTPEDAQAQAEGLLRFFSRFVKSGSLTIPGEPIVKLGTTIQVQGELRGLTINETFYIEGVQHDYADGSHYTTTLQLTHGRDPWDPKWGLMVMPKFGPGDLAQNGGVLGDPAPGGGGAQGSNYSGDYPLGKVGAIIGRPYQGTHSVGNWESDNAIDISVPVGTEVIAAEDGVVRAGGMWNTPYDLNSRFSGWEIPLYGTYHTFWYTHCSKRYVNDGDRVGKGDVIGLSGGGNGVPHLHIAVKPPTNPLDLWGNVRTVTLRDPTKTGAGGGRPNN